MTVLIKDLARKEATDVLDKHWRGTFPVDVFAVAQSLGADVFTADIADDLSGFITRKDGGQVEIYLNRYESPLRQRFTCAHELGHLVDRRNRKDDDYSFISKRHGRADNAFEWYADHFAANLLMPQSEVERLEDLRWNTTEMAERFGVSIGAMEVRRRHLRGARQRG